MNSVTQILGSISPFPESERVKWINSVNAELEATGQETMTFEDLMHATQISGDILHTYLINRAMGYPQGDVPERFSHYRDHIDRFISEYEVEGIAAEFRIEKPGEYIGHPDLVCYLKWEGKRVKALVDGKTYQLYRDLLRLPKKEKEVKLCGHAPTVGLQCSMYKDAFIYSRPDLWDVSHMFCAHIRHDRVDLVELKYDISKYLKWLHQPQKIVEPAGLFLF